MKKGILILFMLIASCQQAGETKPFRKNFTPEELKLMRLSRNIIRQAYFAVLVTHANEKEMRTRIMEPFPPDSTFTVWFGTNRKSRKVKEIRKNPYVSVFYFDRNAPAYVSLYGIAKIIDDPVSKQKYWRKAWANFYPDRKNYVLIKFVPYRIEMIAPSQGLPGDSVTWRPYTVILRK